MKILLIGGTSLVGPHLIKELLTENEWIKKIANICGWKGRIKTQIGSSEDSGYKQDFYVSSQKIRNDLGFYEKYNPDDGLEENVMFLAYQHFAKTYKKNY